MSENLRFNEPLSPINFAEKAAFVLLTSVTDSQNTYKATFTKYRDTEGQLCARYSCSGEGFGLSENDLITFVVDPNYKFGQTSELSKLCNPYFLEIFSPINSSKIFSGGALPTKKILGFLSKEGIKRIREKSGFDIDGSFNNVIMTLIGFVSGNNSQYSEIRDVKSIPTQQEDTQLFQKVCNSIISSKFLINNSR